MTFLLLFICTRLCGGQKTSFRGPFSASTLWVPGLEHRLGRLAASAFTPLSHRANVFFCICSMLSLAQNSWAQVTCVPLHRLHWVLLACAPGCDKLPLGLLIRLMMTAAFNAYLSILTPKDKETNKDSEWKITRKANWRKVNSFHFVCEGDMNFLNQLQRAVNSMRWCVTGRTLIPRCNVANKPETWGIGTLASGRWKQRGLDVWEPEMAEGVQAQLRQLSETLSQKDDLKEQGSELGVLF